MRPDVGYFWLLLYFYSTPVHRPGQPTFAPASTLSPSYGFTPNNMFVFPPGRYITFLDLDSVSATSRAASIRRSSTSAGPALFVAWLISLADSDSPSARITAACISCSDRSTTKRARSASCCDTCFASIAREYSTPKERCVSATSSSTMPKSFARTRKALLTFSLTASRMVRSWSALNCATVAFSTSLPIDGNTLSSYSGPRLTWISESRSTSGR
mmetsp:Transcript_5257/g.19670  ORF Transcript_5257/g.19670 Transcript_5257/m.19670 type:complete len:215 (+) Transcript_5257:2665-3309(+)